MSQQPVKQEIIDSINRLKKAAVQEGITIDAIFLFGSRAKDQAKSYSDIDIGVVSADFGKDSIQEGARLRLLADRIDWRLEPHPLHPGDLKQRENPFISEILTTGIRI